MHVPSHSENRKSSGYVLNAYGRRRAPDTPGKIKWEDDMKPLMLSHLETNTRGFTMCSPYREDTRNERLVTYDLQGQFIAIKRGGLIRCP